MIVKVFSCTNTEKNYCFGFYNENNTIQYVNIYKEIVDIEGIRFFIENKLMVEYDANEITGYRFVKVCVDKENQNKTQFTTDTHVIKRAIIPCKTADGEEKEIHITKTDNVFTITHHRKDSITLGESSGDLFSNIFQSMNQEQRIDASVIEKIARVVLDMGND